MTSSRPKPSTSWVWWSLLPIGLGAWTPIYAGVRARRPLWIALGAIWCVLGITGMLMSSATEKDSSRAGILMIIAWTGGIVTAFSLRDPYRRALTDPRERALRAARERIDDREKARALAASDPRLARELGIGRPDIRGAHDGGVVDVNAAPAGALARLPGVDDALAARIVEVRKRVNGFSSAEDLSSLLDLEPDIVPDLRERTVFMER